MCNLVELSCRGQVAPEWLFHNDACRFGQVRRAETLDDRLEERWRNSKIMRRSPRFSELYRPQDQCPLLANRKTYSRIRNRSSTRKAVTFHGLNGLMQIH
jgi:hypothetical protein